MDTEMSNKQLVRLAPDAVRAIKAYRRDVRRTRGERLSINTAINDLIRFGWENQKDALERDLLSDAAIFNAISRVAK